jgi:hypothetical protein
MLKRWTRPLRVWGLALCVALGLSACGLYGWMYERGPSLALWWLQGYVDLDRAQRARAEEALRQWFRWHHAQELPRYVALLDQAQQQVLSNTQAEAVCQWNTELQLRADQAYLAFEPAMASYLASTTPIQWEEMEDRMKRQQERFEDSYVRGDATQRLEASVERSRKWAKRLYGRLTPAQEVQLQRLVSQSPFDAPSWAQERLARQRDFLRWLRQSHSERASAADWQQGVRQHWRFGRDSPRVAYQRYQQALMRYNCEAIAQFHNGTSPTQRQHAQRLLGDWRQTFSEWAAAPAP